MFHTSLPVLFPLMSGFVNLPYDRLQGSSAFQELFVTFFNPAIGQTGKKIMVEKL